jgi:hypothetical protein
MDDSEQLFKNYQELDGLAKSIVDMAVLIFESVSFYEFQSFYVNHVNKTADYKFKDAIRLLRKKDIISGVDFNNLKLPLQFMIMIFPEVVKNPDNQAFIQLVERKFPAENLYGTYRRTLTSRTMRQMLRGYFQDDKKLFKDSLEIISKRMKEVDDLFAEMIHFPAYHDFLIQLGPRVLQFTVYRSFNNHVFMLEGTSQLEHFLFYTKEEQAKIGVDVKITLDPFLSALSLYKGKIQEASVYNQNIKSEISIWTQGLLEIYKGQLQQGNHSFFDGLANFRKITGNTKFIPENCYLLFALLAVIAEGSDENSPSLAKLVKILEKIKALDDNMILPLAYQANNQQYEARKALIKIKEYHSCLLPFNEIVLVISAFLIEEELDETLMGLTRELLDVTHINGYLLFTLELSCLLYKATGTDRDKKKMGALIDQLGVQPLLSKIERKEEWEQSLNSLLGIATGKSKTKAEETNRLVYIVNFDNRYIQPTLQTYSTKGWSAGRNIALKRLKERQIECMTDQDVRIATAIKRDSSYYGSEYYIDYPKMLTEIAGHPYLFHASNPDISVELVRAQPELITEKTAKGYLLQTDVTETEQKVTIKKETNTRYKLIQLTEEQLSVIRALKAGKLLVPEAGKEKLIKTMSHLSSFMTIHSDLAGTDTSLRQVEADPRIRVQLLPIGDSLKAEWFVKPFSTVPPYSKPGKGGKTVYGTLNDEKCIATRDLDLETRNMTTLSSELNNLLDIDLSEDAVFFEDPHDCLALLETLQQQTSIAVVEWPEGERFKVKQSATFSQLSLSVKAKGYWFELSGELKVDENTVLSLKQLLELSSKSKGRFVELGNGEFMALSAEFKKRLDELTMYADVDKSNVKINKFAVPAIEELTESVGSFHSDKAWKDFQKKITENQNTVYTVPVNLQAELRPYQEEGFYWLARLADWDAGACLADDMGLGKTLQALALLLHRAEKGPALVICPASVGANWAAETERFAPSLNILTLRNNHREEVLENLAPFDILIITYGILQSEEDRLSQINWTTVVLDEAHAIKNNQTKTSKAAMTIKADFRLILTGTPIQNHLGELWNLFNFINPGLLGSLKKYNERFVNPVLKYGSTAEKNLLKKLIAPFILRRTKSNVLDELPPKTEITKIVELSDEETAFYEALRRQAIENIETSDGPTGQQHLKALAEITKLRLACCNPLLVNKNIDIPSSKLNTFVEIVDELIENKHRALVFSQFIGHLSIVRNKLEEKNISYQYLDGSTPIDDRAKIVKDFQSGKGDLFLISLKAGGLGLNLTAADYVIHLDPWWNPAIEDQASDRAHRIGQNRPVTIYRLVAKDTIEEKIIKLHHSKRDLADSLLEGSDQSAKLNTEDLLNLLKEG